MRAKAWCWTLNNYTQEQDAELQKSTTQTSIISYSVFGREVGEQGTPHLQGYTEFCTRRTLSSVKELLNLPTAHLEKRKGSAKQASDYCKKDGDFFETGVLSAQGERKDLKRIFEDIKEGCSEIDIIESNPQKWCMYRKAFQAYRDLLVPDRTWKTYVHVLIGPTGCGKTSFVFKQPHTGSHYIHVGREWFDGYVGQEIVLFDDFGPDYGISWCMLLRLLDRYPMQVPIKGGFVRWAPRIIYITSNFPTYKWYPGQDLSPLERRIDLLQEGNFLS